jgi:hypothetical protein
MLHFHPDKHREVIVNAIKRCFDEGEVIGRPISPTPKSGECYIIAFNKTYCIDEEDLSKLEQEAHLRWKEDTGIRFAKELAVPLEDVEHLVEYAYTMKLFLVYPAKNAYIDAVEKALKIPQGSTSCLHPKHLPYYLQGETDKK